MNGQNLTPKSKALIIEKLKEAAGSVSGNKILEFGCPVCTPAAELCSEYEFYICIDNFEGFNERQFSEAQKNLINVIPYEEINEDCYFGRFHLVYTIFEFHDRKHLADEIMRLRRLIIKQGKIVIIDLQEDGLEDRYLKQMKLCGFSDSAVEYLDLDGERAFLISAEK